MRLQRSLPARGAHSSPLALALGVFDGVHRGHQAVLKAAVSLARKRGWKAAALTFDPPPEAALGLPVPLRLGHPAEQLEALQSLGLDELYRIPFTRALGSRSAAAFAAEVLARRLRCGAVVVGHGFRFGAGARGTVADLKKLGLALGFETLEVAPFQLGGTTASSTRLRHAVQAGKLAEAAKLLGRPWRLRGKVVTGRKLGRKLGFPTANLNSPQQALPPTGVWAGRCRVIASKGPQRWWGFAGNIGHRPTLGSGLKMTVELNLLGFKGALEGKTLEAEFFRRLRPEKRFASLDALKAQIATDAARARTLTKGRLA